MAPVEAAKTPCLILIFFTFLSLLNPIILFFFLLKRTVYINTVWLTFHGIPILPNDLFVFHNSFSQSFRDVLWWPHRSSYGQFDTIKIMILIRCTYRETSTDKSIQTIYIHREGIYFGFKVTVITLNVEGYGFTGLGFTDSLFMVVMDDVKLSLTATKMLLKVSNGLL